MGSPGVFISCVSSEFRSVRRQVADVLLRLGYTPMTQEILGTEGGDLRQVLREKIDPCMGLIQIVGRGYGAEPPTVDPAYGRVSYTQFELLYARGRKKKTWVVFAGDDCTRDTPIDRLDLPADPDHPDPAGYQRERRALQDAYRAAQAVGGELYHLADSNAELVLKVEQLKDGLAELRRGEARWKSRVLASLAAVVLLLLLIGGGVWWVGRAQRGIGAQQEKIGARQEEIGAQVQILATDRQVTRDKIRGHLFESAERAKQAALAEAEKAAGWQERQRLREAAEAEHAARLARIDALAADFAEIEGTASATPVFNELTRILADEGVDAALAFVQSRRAGILERARARAALAREKNRDELLPLLRSAQLCVARSDFSQAAALFADVFALEPDWPAALDARFGFFVAQADRASSHGSTGQTRHFAESAAADARHLVEFDPANAQWQRDLTVSYNKVGDVLSAQGDGAGALKAYRDSLAIAGRLAKADPANAEWQRDLWVSYGKIALALEAQSDPEAGTFWRRARDTLKGIKTRGLFVSPGDERVLELLESKAKGP